MTKWHVVMTETALSDVEEAAWYMRRRLGSPKAACSFVRKVQGKVDLLSKLPLSCPSVTDGALAKVGYRWCAVGNYLMFFTIAEDTQTVCVERVLYGASDWESVL